MNSFTKTLGFVALAHTLIIIGSLSGCSTDAAFSTVSESAISEASEDIDAGNEYEADDDDQDDERHLNRCATLMNVASEKVKTVVVAGSKRFKELSADEVLLVKIARTQKQVNLSFESNQPLAAGFCVVVIGCKTSVSINVKGEMKRASFIGVGSLNKSEIRVEPLSRIHEAVSVRIAGIRNVLRIGGPGQYSCPVAAGSVGFANSIACN